MHAEYSEEKLRNFYFNRQLLPRCEMKAAGKNECPVAVTGHFQLERNRQRQITSQSTRSKHKAPKSLKAAPGTTKSAAISRQAEAAIILFCFQRINPVVVWLRHNGALLCILATHVC